MSSSTGHVSAVDTDADMTQVGKRGRAGNAHEHEHTLPVMSGVRLFEQRQGRARTGVNHGSAEHGLRSSGPEPTVPEFWSCQPTPTSSRPVTPRGRRSSAPEEEHRRSRSKERPQDPELPDRLRKCEQWIHHFDKYCDSSGVQGLKETQAVVGEFFKALQLLDDRVTNIDQIMTQVGQELEKHLH